MSNKKCPSCQQEKDTSLFHKNRTTKDGFQWHCIECRKKIDCRPEKRAQDRQRYHENKDTYLNQYYKRVYKIGLKEYDALLTKQNNVCAICEKECSSGRRLAVDHDHDTGKVRALLCGICNRGLGYFQHNPQIITEAIKYLEKYAS